MFSVFEGGGGGVWQPDVIGVSLLHINMTSIHVFWVAAVTCNGLFTVVQIEHVRMFKNEEWSKLKLR